MAIIGSRDGTRDRCRPFRDATRAEYVEELGPDLDAVLVFGGDGTVHRNLARLVEANAPVLVVPTGSGNDFASSLGTGNPRHALKLWRQFVRKPTNVRTIDLGRVTGPSSKHLFCNVANFGLDSEINRLANLLPRFLRANGGYVLSLFPALLKYRAPKVTIRFDDRTIHEAMLLSVAGNGGRYGRGVRIAPHAKMDDGLLDLCFIRNLSKVKIATIFPVVFLGWHVNLPEVKYARFRRLEIESEKPVDVYADGEYLCRTPATIEVVPNAMQVIAP